MTMADWMGWLVAAGVLVILELFTGTFYLLMIAIGLASAGSWPLLGAAGPVQTLAAAAVGVLATALLHRALRPAGAQRQSRPQRQPRHRPARHGAGLGGWPCARDVPRRAVGRRAGPGRHAAGRRLSHRRGAGQPADRREFIYKICFKNNSSIRDAHGIIFRYDGAGAFIIALVFVFKTINVVPQQHAWVVERLGKYHATLAPGLNIVMPFIDRIAYKHILKEIPLDVPPQVCITRDNTQLQVDGILYFQVTDAMRASYGASNYIQAITQLAQTTLRSVIGKMELDKTFEERDHINTTIVNAIDESAANWGVKVLRYEIKDLTPPAEILHSMQRQITAEREKRALIAASEGRRQEQINIASGEREASIARSEGERQASINRAQGEASAIVALAEASAKRCARWATRSASRAAWTR
jgi:regulator of protease activity HflC (stomatin/prohibitin superfamily)